MVADVHVELEALHQVASGLNSLLTDQFAHNGPLDATAMARSTQVSVMQMPDLAGQTKYAASVAVSGGDPSASLSSYGNLFNADALTGAHGSWMMAASGLVATVHAVTDDLQQRVLATHATYTDTEANLHESTIRTTRGV